MPKIPNTVRVGAVYYARKRVPTDLEKVMGKSEIRVSLGTKDYREASRLVPAELVKMEARFDEARRSGVPRSRSTPSDMVPMTTITDSEAMRLVATWFIEQEKTAETWWEKTGLNLTAEEREQVEQNVSADLAAYTHSGGTYAPDDGSAELDRLLAARGMTIAKGSSAYERLRGLLRQGLEEHSSRALARLQRSPSPTQNPAFSQWSGSSEPPASSKKFTLGELVEAFTAHHKTVNPEKALLNYNIPIRLLVDVFSKRATLQSITPQELSKFFDLLERIPVNARQRYGDISMVATIEAADKKGDKTRLAAKTLENYYRLIVALFNFAVEMEMIAKNPASKATFRDRFEIDDEDRVPKELFTVEQLNKLFRAPLYTGSQDDERGYMVPGPNVVRRGRYWVPLLALFHGFRLNEVCQLYSEDVEQEEGIWYLWIRKGLDGGKKSADKRLKNKASKRRVPIHGELIRLGFLEFVKQRKADAESPRLFAELLTDKQGAYSGPFSKFFGRFRTKAVPEAKATFHSFRHMWRTALLHAEVGVPDVEAMGGWDSERGSSEKIYNHGQLLSKLKAQIDKLKYPGLDLSHLKPFLPVRVRPPMP